MPPASFWVRYAASAAHMYYHKVSRRKGQLFFKLYRTSSPPPFQKTVRHPCQSAHRRRLPARAHDGRRAHAAVLAPVGDHIDGDQLKGRDIDDQKRTHFITGRSPSEGPRLFCLLRSSSKASSSSMAFSPAGVAAQPRPSILAIILVEIWAAAGWSSGISGNKSRITGLTFSVSATMSPGPLPRP